MQTPVNVYTRFLLLSALLWLASCDRAGPEDALMTGAFGFAFGERPQGLGDLFLSELKTIPATDPPSPDSRFEHYSYTVTPGSHRVYQINATTGTNLTRPACESLHADLAAELSQAYFSEDEAVISHDEGKWTLQRTTKRAVTLECIKVVSQDNARDEPLYQLSLSYLDYNLAAAAYQEWKKTMATYKPDKY